MQQRSPGAEAASRATADHRAHRRLGSAAALATACAVGLSMFSVAPANAAEVTNTIAAVQGTAATQGPNGISPLDGQVVTVEGVVTGDHRGTASNRGLYIQTAGSGGSTDATPGASDGLFVFLSSNPAAGVAIGDKVKVTGRVSDFNTVTQVSATAAGSVELVQAGVGVPAVTPLAATVLGSAREAFEAMLVRPSGTYKLVSSHNLQSFGELWTSAGSTMPVEAFETQTPTTVKDGATIVNPAATAVTTANNSARLILDDGYSVGISDAAHPGDQPYFTKDKVVRNGDVVNFPEGGSLLSFGFGNWRLQPPTPINDASPANLKPTFSTLASDGKTVIGNPRPAAPPVVGGDIQVASFNVLNYFTTLSSDNPAARGAETAEEFAIQESKIVTAINELDADVVALQEIENSVKLGEAPDEALSSLVKALNAAAGKTVWDYVRTPDELHDAAITDVITNAIIYKPSVVKPSGEAQTVIDETVWDIAREPIAQTFKYGKQFVTVIANHFKSKSGTDPNKQPGQDAFNAERVEQAQALLKFANSVSDGRKNAVYLIGDFNSYAKEDPIKVFTDAGWNDLLFTRARGQYTYTFDGELGSLDHVIASPAASDRVDKVAVWGINSPEWSQREYWGTAAESGTPFRSSDHDPILVGVKTGAAPGTVNIDLVTVNDFHGRIEQSAPSGGIAALSSAVKQIRAENPNTVFAAAGDMIGASTFTSFIQKDVPTIETLNEAGLDVSSVGNHEFDQGFADLTDRVMPLALWEYLGANVYKKGTMEAALPEYWTQTFDDVTIGFVGAVTDELPSLVSPDGIKDIEVGPPVEAANRVADQLSDGNDENGEADIVVLLVHEGAVDTTKASATDPSTRFGKIVTGVNANVDAIVSGHTHLAYNHVVERADGAPMPVISSGQYGERFSRMDIDYNRATKSFTMKNEIFNMMDGTTALYPNDPAVTPIVAEAVEVANVLGSRVLGTATADFGRAVASNPVGASSFPENRGGESTLGNLVADVQLWSLNEDQPRGVQIAFMNPGGLRADLAGGEVTYREAADVQPFANTLVTLKLTGAQVKKVLEEQWQPTGASRPFLKLGVNKELTYTYNPSAPVGSHITEILLNGIPLNPTATYIVGANSFLAAGGDNFFTLAEGTNKADSGKIDLESMVDYFAADADHTISPDVKQRAVGVHLPGGTSVAAGSTVTVNLSSLDFTRTEPDADVANITLKGGDGTVLGSAPINTAYTPTTDEVGKASVTFTIPGDASGATTFVVTVPSTGTTSSFTLNIG
ncbi:5'-nucleotidase [Agromyces flavus]|uniref:5'-nucleotidase n=1 Tax=Agromyces flavus TaxID=589382 RepID=A0A1H1L8Z7_9MICO|nr:ExeM/NucH family extracellular endonuclease [Agromyces flavus]MCP2367474.1 5'-nucleotidase [Agromyces flavus]GGI45659.1 multifunctional nuclease/2',3'-cyclic-nucleotide 2'-phosphodiesterase/5'-nucleotidase/3'-nucleotidase [Agromyces flavus]SDR70897.1 5'-nucleotidase [Agromyces flavus]